MARPRRTETTPQPRDITETYVGVEPSWASRYAAIWAGWCDGRRGIEPDPNTGLTPYLYGLMATNATMVESERLRTQHHIAPLDQERIRHIERRDHALDTLRTLHSEATETPTTSGPDSPEAVAAIRTHRAHHTRIAATHTAIAAATEHISVLDELRADRVTAGALRIQRCTQRTHHLFARYWRAYIRHHPERAELRQAYTVPTVPIPPHPLGL